MQHDDIVRIFTESAASEISLVPDGPERYRVFAPFGFDDGDEFAIVLKREQGSEWVLSDEGNTLMHLSYDINLDSLEKGVRRELFSNAILAHEIDNHQGELSTRIRDDQFGSCFYSFVQGLLRISDLTYLSRERVKTTFKEDVQQWLAEHIPEDRRTFDWHDPHRDPDAKYRADCRIDGRYPPVFVHALSNNDRTRDATISLLKFADWELDFKAVGIYKKGARISRSVRERFEDVCGHSYLGLEENEEFIRRELTTLTSDYF